MPERVDRDARRARIGALATDFVRTSIGFIPVVLLVRLSERLMVRASHTLPAASAREWLLAIGSDVSFALLVAAVLAVPVLAVGSRWPRTARALHRLVLVGLALTGALLARYYAVTFVPLGADLFGYSLSDIRETVAASGGVSYGALLSAALIVVVAWLAPRLTRRLPVNRLGGALFASACVAVLVVPPLRTLPSGAFQSDAAYNTALNKTLWFGGRSMRLLATRLLPANIAGLRGYPLLRQVRYDDVLGPLLHKGARPPNLVFIIVEGLGRDFTGPDAELGGFTPFLDSLAERSLSWDNFLSTSGRTFGILPSLLGSLPFGQSGFMELGARMPDHLTLGAVLRGSGYRTNYFTGTNGQYDRIDAFMERQRVDRFIDLAGFGPGFARQPASVGGESWGYPDDALFRRSLDVIGNDATTPRLDVYLTITTHEPFIPPREAAYGALFERRLGTLRVSKAKRAVYRDHTSIFETLLYTDDAIRGFVEAYAARPDFANTIFLITGDHRLIPIPPSNRIARYHVPFIVYSPMLRAPRHVRAVSSHLDVVPSVLALLRNLYGLTMPDTAAWLGTGLDTATSFRHAGAVALMRTKNALDDYLDGTRFLSDGQLFGLDERFELTPIDSPAVRDSLSDRLDHFRAVNRYVTRTNQLIPRRLLGPDAVAMDPEAIAREDRAFRALDLEKRTPVQVFETARELATQRQSATTRLVLQRLLRDAPSYHDARALLGRTFAWERRFDEASVILDDLVRRAPDYADGYAARIDLDLYRERAQPALIAVTEALSRFPDDPGLLYRKARALELLGDRPQAVAVLRELQRVQPRFPEADSLRARLRQP